MGGGGKGGFWVDTTLTCSPQKNRAISERGRILSPNLSMGDRIHERCSMKPPRCPGRRKNPYSGWHTAKIFAWAVSIRLPSVGRVGSVYSGLLVNLLMCDRGGALYSVHITI